MGLLGRFGPLGEKWETEKRKRRQPTWATWGPCGGAAAPPWPHHHVGISPTWLGQGERFPPSHYIKGGTPPLFSIQFSLSLSSLLQPRSSQGEAGAGAWGHGLRAWRTGGSGSAPGGSRPARRSSGRQQGWARVGDGGWRGEGIDPRVSRARGWCVSRACVFFPVCG